MVQAVGQLHHRGVRARQQGLHQESELDEECLKQRGWVPLGGDIARKPSEKPSAGGANKDSNKY